MRQKIAPKTLRMLPQHLDLEGLLARHFGGPDIAHSYYDHAVFRSGLSPRFETFRQGSEFPDLGEALRLFERYPQQVGMVVYVGDGLAGATVMPHPDDYAAMHMTFLTDYFAKTLYWYGLMNNEVPKFAFAMPNRTYRSLSDIKAVFQSTYDEFVELELDLELLLEDRDLIENSEYKMGDYELSTFLTDLAITEGQLAGERIVRSDGTLAYLKLSRLDAEQAERAQLLEVLARHEWDLHEAASSRNQSTWQLFRDFQDRGLGYLFKGRNRLYFDRLMR